MSTEPPLSQNSRDCGGRLPARPTRFVIAFGIVIFAAVVLSAIGFWNFRPAKSPPQVDLSQANADIAALIQKSREQVINSPGNAAAWGRLGMELFAHEWETEAAFCFEQAAELNGSEPKWPYLHALTVMSGDREKAAILLRQAIGSRTDFGVARNRLGELLLESNALKEAEAELVIAHRSHPDALRPLLALARVAWLGGRPDEAKRWAQDAAAKDPSLRSVHELLAMICQATGDRAAADREMKIAESLPDRPLEWDDPIAADVLSRRRDTRWKSMQAEELLASGDYSRGIRLLQQILTLDKGEPKVFSILGRALTEVGDLQSAMIVLTDAATLHPDSADIHFQKGSTLFLRGEFNAARESFENAIRLKPDFALALFNLANTMEQLGDSENALAAYRRSVAAQPSLVPGYTGAAKILVSRGEKSAAGELLQSALIVSPGNSTVADMMRELSETEATPQETEKKSD